MKSLLLLKMAIWGILFLSVSSVTSIVAQDTEPKEVFSWGLTAGYCYFDYSADLRPLPTVNSVLPMQAKGDNNSFFAGAIFDFPISRIVTIRPSLLYYQERAVITAQSSNQVHISGNNVEGVTEHEIFTNLCNTRLELSVKANLPFKLSILGGMYAGYNHYNQSYHHLEKAVSPEGASLITGDKIFHYTDPGIDKRFNSGFILGLEYSIINSRKNRLGLNVSYSFGMANVAKELDFDVYSIRAGVSFMFNVLSGNEPAEPEQMAAVSN